MSNTCKVTDCGYRISKTTAMCKWHFAQVPLETRTALARERVGTEAWTAAWNAAFYEVDPAMREKRDAMLKAKAEREATPEATDAEVEAMKAQLTMLGRHSGKTRATEKHVKRLLSPAEVEALGPAVIAEVPEPEVFHHRRPVGTRWRRLDTPQLTDPTVRDLACYGDNGLVVISTAVVEGERRQWMLTITTRRGSVKPSHVDYVLRSFKFPSGCKRLVGKSSVSVVLNDMPDLRGNDFAVIEGG